ncbi:50S ribosomal protein L25/general stress protein Ctc [Piscirickettsia salmonis]|uniref:50S ribosomal protein L25/general stress protein Ctc n=1 Tax=Piscirickettsia salmonis TaxID=1238 RepID=UPI000F097426|nr:50S ribosomal protein L25 [Piscirickettsiaceae bacterium NZ-RLO2]
MSQTIELPAALRQDKGKGASRRLRRIADQVPAIVYGGNKDPMSLAIPHNLVLQVEEHEHFYTQILTLNIDGQKEQVILKDMQRHPYKPKVTHLDFQRVDANSKLSVSIPLHFTNEEVAVKLGGHVEHYASEVEISCLPADLPEFIEVDMGKTELGQTLHLSDIKVPQGVTLSALVQGGNHDHAIVAIKANKGSSDDDAASSDEGTAEE